MEPTEPFRCYLRALEPGDDAVTLEWRRHDRIWEGLIGPRRAVSSVTEAQWLTRAIERHARGELMRFGVCLPDDDRLVGLLKFGDIDLVNRSCEAGWMLGDPSVVGRGVAYDANVIGFHYMFANWGVARIQARILGDNARSIRSFERFGAQLEGVLRRAARRDGEAIDVRVYSILRDEFYALHGERARRPGGLR